jgi:tetratricopeptide (TPR) repeat protein
MLLFIVSLPVTAEAKPWAWVWYPGQWRHSNRHYFGRRNFTIDSDVQAAYVFFSGDNFTSLFLNGKRIGGSGDWYTLKPVTIETLGPLLRKGKNVLAAHVQNDDYEGGFILKGMILLANGKRIVLNSNEAWRCADKQVKDWEKVGFDDSAWVASESIGTPPAGPWGSPTMPPSRHRLGSLNVADPQSEKTLGYSGRGDMVDSTLTYADGTKLTDRGRRIAASESFTIKLGPAGYLVLRRRLAAGQSGDVRVAIEGKDAGVWHSAPPGDGKWADAFFVVPYKLTLGKRQVAITLTPTQPKKYVAYHYDFLTTFEWFTFNADATRSQNRTALDETYRRSPKDAATAFRYALALEGERRWAAAEAAYRRCAELAAQSDLGESAYRSARLARAMRAFRAADGNASRLFDIGVYLKLNGFYTAAIEALGASIDTKPTGDAYDQLGETMLYGGRGAEECIKVWKAGLERFPPKDTNRWSCIIALRPKPEQEKLIGAQKKQLQMFIDMVHASSRGRMALDARILVSPPPPPKLFGDGKLDSFINLVGGAGGGGTLGPDVTYGHSGWSGFGFVTVYGVAWHEWIHQLECGLASSRNGQGWGGCHSSTQFGYRPPWEHWYRASMRYYIRPGQYQRVCIADHANVPHADKWLVKGPFPSPDVSPKWICYPTKRTGNKVAWNTRKTFTLPGTPTKATIAATGDNWCVTWVNGRRVGTGGSWAHAPKLDITRHLRKGANVIALSTLNDDHGGGVLAHAIIELKDGRRIVLATDESWKTNLSDEKEFRTLHSATQPAAPPWTKGDFDDAAWKPSEAIGRYPCPPWNVIRIDLADRLMTKDFVGPSAAAPSVADGWKPVTLKGKVATLKEIAPPSNDTYQTLTCAFTYVYAPADMRVQMSLGASRRTFLTLNGEEIRKHMGNGLPTLPNVFPVYLKKGWNRLLLRAEDIAGKSVFWVKIYRSNGGAIEGLKYANEKPRSGIVPDQHTLPTFTATRHKLYSWADVAEDPYTLMPRLTADDLATLTGYKGLTLHGGNNFLFVDLKGGAGRSGYKPLVAYTGGEHDVNNALTWDFEPAAIVRYARGRKTRDLLLIKPDAIEAVFETNLLKAASNAHPRRAVLGWVLVNGRLCVVAEGQLGPLPRRTMDLLGVGK